MQSFINPQDAAQWVLSGKILLHPTEGVWGLGCLFDSKIAADRITEIKLRSDSKNYILLMPNLAWVEKLGKNIKPSNLEEFKQYWPGHTTFLFEPSKECPGHLVSSINRVAMRVSAHKPILDLLDIIQKPILSTSANISGKQPNIDIHSIKKLFNYTDVAQYEKPLGNQNKPSRIIDFLSKEVIRE
ncbi:MAG: Sua5/YciO/YrdC/YwlC family protein [Gammaproteobacteria bacterium]